MIEGTKQYPGPLFAQIIESYGMSLEIIPGQIIMSMLSKDLAMGLQLLNQILTQATIEQNAVEKVRTQLLADLKQYWDTPTSFAIQLMRAALYHGHPYSKSMIGTANSLATITREDLLTAYHSYFAPEGARFAIVGDLAGYDIKKLLHESLQEWTGSPHKKTEYPPLAPISARDINYPINRDQVLLAFGSNSINRMHPDFDALLLFDQIFAGGVLGSMSSRLFALREQSGLFYTVSGSLLEHCDEQPGTIFIKTLVSIDRLAEAREALMNTIKHAADTIEDHELAQAKDAIIHSLVDNFSANRKMASTFIYLDRFNFPANYFDTRAEVINKLSKEDVVAAVKRLLDGKQFITLQIGRIG
jgi:zinc protease